MSADTPAAKTVYGIDAERMRAFSDAVVAIAITLLALDMKVPEGLRADELGHALREALPSIRGYLLSFAVIGVLWISHHGVFAMVETLDRRLLNLNLALLAAIAALPFPTKLISGIDNSALAVSVYAGTIALCSLLLMAMSIHLLRRPGQRRPDVPRQRVVQAILQSAVVVVVFGTSILVALISESAAQYWWILCVPLRLLLAWWSARTAD